MTFLQLLDPTVVFTLDARVDVDTAFAQTIQIYGDAIDPLTAAVDGLTGQNDPTATALGTQGVLADAIVTQHAIIADQISTLSTDIFLEASPYIEANINDGEARSNSGPGVSGDGNIPPEVGDPITGLNPRWQDAHAKLTATMNNVPIIDPPMLPWDALNTEVASSIQVSDVASVVMKSLPAGPTPADVAALQSRVKDLEDGIASGAAQGPAGEAGPPGPPGPPGAAAPPRQVLVVY